MPRPIETAISRSPGFTPEVSAPPQLGVFAPLNVTAEKSGADALAKALGIAQQAAAPLVERHIVKDAEARTSQGMLDQQLNKVDPKRQAEDHLYDRGVKRVAVENASIKALSDWQTRYDTEIDKTLGTDAITADFDSFMKDRLAPFLSDPEASKWAYNRIGPAASKIFIEHNAELANQFKDTTVATVSDSIRTSLANRQNVNPDDMKQMLAAAGLSPAEQASNYVDIVGTLAVETHDPKLLDALIPDHWEDGTPGPRRTPKLAEKLNQARYYAEAAQKQDQQEQDKAATQLSESNFVGVMHEAVTGNIGNARKMLDTMAANGTIKRREDYAAMVNFIDSRLNHDREESFNPLKLAQFRMELAADPLSFDMGDVIQRVGSLVPQGKDGFIAAAQLMDDITAAQKSARAAEANPKAKAYRAALVTRYKPDTGSTQAKKDRFAAAVQAFDLEFAENNDPEAANAAAQKVLQHTDSIEKTASGNVSDDAKSFATGQIDGSEFRRKYGNSSGVQALMQSYRAGKTGLTEDQYRAALLQLKGD